MMNHLFLCVFLGVSTYAMTLEESVSYALQNNYDLQQKNISIKQSKYIRESKRSKKFGRLDLIASYDHYNNARTLSPLTPMSIVGTPDGAYSIPATNDMLSIGVAYNVVLFDGYKQRISYEISDLAYKSSSIQTHLSREELIYNVRNVYISILALQELIDAQNIYTKSQERLFNRIEKEFELGSKSKLDCLKAKTSVTSSISKSDSLQANLNILKTTLSALMGGKSFENLKNIEISMFNNIENISKTKIKSLDRYKSSQINVQAAKRKRQQVKSAYYPQVDFSAYVGENFGPNDTENTVPLANSASTAGQTLIDKGDWNHELNWQIGLHLKYNILDFGQTSSLDEEARLASLKAKIGVEGLEVELQKNIITAQNKMKLSMAEYNNFDAQYKLLSQTYEIEKITYDNDALSLTDLLDTSAKKELMYAQMINAKYTYQKAKYYLDYLLEKGEIK